MFFTEISKNTVRLIVLTKRLFLLRQPETPIPSANGFKFFKESVYIVNTEFFKTVE